MRPRSLHPTRRHVLPWLVVAFPACWFVHREYAPLDSTLLPAVGAALAALAGSYLVAAGVASVADARAWRLDALGPSERGWPLLAALLVGVFAYFALSLFGAVPGWVDALATPVGVVVGLPLLVAILGIIAVGNAFGPLPVAVEAAAVAASLSLTAVWTVFLADAVAMAVGRLVRRLAGDARGE